MCVGTHAMVDVWKSEDKSQFLPCKLQIWLLLNEQSNLLWVFLEENNKIYRFTQGKKRKYQLLHFHHMNSKDRN